MGFGSAATNRNHSTGFRSRSHRTTSTAGSDWINYPDSLDSIGERLRGVIIERRDAFDLIKYHDSDESLFYVDPPYLHDTRHAGSERCYAHEMDTAGHERLLGMLKRVKGMVVLSGYDHFMGFGSAATNRNHSTGFRSRSHRTTSTAGSDWINYPDSLDSIGERLRGVIIERRDAFDLIKYHDSDESLFYVDPPYLHDTRHAGSERCYAHEMDTAGHERLLGMLKRVKGMVVLSGYDHDLYNDCLKGWRKEHRTAAADGRGKRTEVIWVKIPDATDRMRQGAYITHQIRTTKRTKDIETAIDSLTTSGSRVTKSAVAALVGLSREQVSRRYAHLFEGLNP